MRKNKTETRSLLSTLWIFVLLNMIFRDLHQFASQGFIEELMSLDISEELVLVFGFILEIPILMVLLPKVLSDVANKWANIVAVIVTSFGMLSVLPSVDLDDIFFMVMEFMALIAIAMIAWKLPALNPTNQTRT
ncbi:DUF6326 family protein [Flagellimonas meishanensis]|uniref:DUF6326 family protein n=1 Tax=Flagellimonas meishanensis TaxID=2873264 RepID=UPI001CA7B3EC|nr:DUF6326 family protein [[Muricauda] meishanensis]